MLFREPTFNYVISGTEAVGGVNPDTWVSAPHLATAFRQAQLYIDPSWQYLNGANGHTASVETQMAAVRTVCFPQDVEVDTTSILLPVLKEYEYYTYNIQSSDWNTQVAVSPDLWSADNKSFIDPEIVRTRWIEYAADAVTAGVLIMGAMTNNSLSTRSILACAVDARWAKAQSQQSDGPLSSEAPVTPTALHQRQAQEVDGWILNMGEVDNHGFLPINDSSWVPISVSLDWLEALTPDVPYVFPTLNLSKPASTLANILMSTNQSYIRPTLDVEDYIAITPYNFYETVIATLFAIVIYIIRRLALKYLTLPRSVVTISNVITIKLYI